MKRTKTVYNSIGLQMARDYECCFSTMCHHVDNEWYGQPFLLEEFQRENMWKPLFACGEMDGLGFRRKYKRALFGLPSGYGKTEFAAALLLTVATMEPKYNGEYGLVASSIDQVSKIQTKVKTMIRLDPEWDRQWDCSAKVITHRETGAKILILPNKADALESWHFNIIIFDELHVYRDDKVWNAGIKGQKVLRNSLAIGITTASEAREGFLWDLLQKVDKDPGMYVYWLGLDDKDNIDNRRAWEKLMVASWVTWEGIEDQRGSASSKMSFERYTANRFPSSKSEYSCFTSQQLAKCMRRNNDFDLSKPFTLGIDGASSGDSFAIVAYQERKDAKGKPYGCTKEWVFDEPDEETGHYRLNEIMELIADIYQRHYPQIVGMDPNRMIVMSNQLDDVYGIETVSFPQNNPTMCQATSLVIHLVKSGTLRLKGCPKTKEHLLNTVEDDKGSYGVRFGKDEKRSKIDAAIALAIAVLAYDSQVRGTEDYVPFN